MFDQRLDRDARSFKSRLASHNLGIDPDDFGSAAFWAEVITRAHSIFTCQPKLVRIASGITVDLQTEVKLRFVTPPPALHPPQPLPLGTLGEGPGHPSSIILSMCSSIASFAFLSIFSIVRPFVMQPGKSGTKADRLPPACPITIGYSMILSPRSHHAPIPIPARIFSTGA